MKADLMAEGRSISRRRIAVIGGVTAGVFGSLRMPDGTDILTMDRGAHEAALRKAGGTLAQIKAKIAPRHLARRA